MSSHLSRRHMPQEDKGEPLRQIHEPHSKSQQHRLGEAKVSFFGPNSVLGKNPTFNLRLKSRVSFIWQRRMLGWTAWVVLAVAVTIFRTLFSLDSGTFLQDFGHFPQQDDASRTLYLQPYPRVIRYDVETDSYRAQNGTVPENNPNAFPVNRPVQLEQQQQQSQDVCQTMHHWQTKSYPICNPLHEIDTLSNALAGNLAFINCGGDRCAFTLQDQQQTIVLKIPKYYRVDRGQRGYAASNKDGMTMERLTKSPFILSTYGYCGLSQLIEYAGGGSLHDLIKRTRLQKTEMLDPLQKLKVALQLVSAVADLHTFEADYKASVTHNDLCCHQFVLVNGVYKLNDFHLARFLQQNRTNMQACHYPATIGHRWLLIHAPEESMQYTLDTEKADDYTIANVMYYVLTNWWIFEGIPASQGLHRLQRGHRPPFPDTIKDSKEPATQTLMKSIQMLWTHNVDERPTSRQIAAYLSDQLHSITGEHVSNDRAIPVSIPPLPEDWDYDDTDFDNNFN